jgi:hypothetical protein
MGLKRGLPMHPRGPVHHLTETQKIKIISLRQIGVSPLAMAHNFSPTMGASVSTIEKFIRSYDKTQVLFSRRDRPRSGRDTIAITAPLADDPFFTLRQQSTVDA